MFKDENRHYSLRKLSVGLASVLIGISFASRNSHTVRADTVTDSSNGAQTVIQTSTKGSNTVVKGRDAAIKINVKDDTNTAAETNAESTPKEQSQTPEVVKKNSDAITQDIKQNAVKASKAVAKVQNNTVKDNSDETTLNTKGRKAVAENMLKEGKTEVKENQDWTDPAKNKLQMSTLRSTTNKKLNAKMLAVSKAISQVNNTNGGFDEDTWGKLDVNNWQGSVQDGLYQLTSYTGDLSHIIIPNEADFEKAGKSTNGLQVGITCDTVHSLVSDQTQTIAFSKTNNQKVKAFGTDWSHAFSADNVSLSKFDGSNLDVSNVTDMHNMFSGNSISDLTSLAHWDTSKVTDMSGMFGQNSISDLTPLAHWDTSKVTNMSDMFYSNSISDLSPLAHWDISKVTNMSSMFWSNKISDLTPLAHWDTSKVTDMSEMFRNNPISNLTSLANWDTGNVTNMNAMFQDNSISNLTSLANWDTSKVTNMDSMFFKNQISDLSPLAHWDTSNVTDMNGMFSDNQISDLSPLAHWDTSNVTSMNGMFIDNQISDLTPLAHWDTSKVTDTGYMFFKNQISDLSPLAHWDTSNVTRMVSMFYYNSISDLIPLANWDTSKLIDMSYMFADNPDLIDLRPIADWNISSINNDFGFSSLFYSDNKLNLTNINNTPLMQGFLKEPDALQGATYITNNADLVKATTGKDLPDSTNTAKRTITFNIPDATPETIVQIINYKAITTVQVNFDNKQIVKTYPVKESDWQLDTSKQNDDVIIDGVICFKPVKIPHVNGYKAYIVPEIKGLLEPDKTVISKQQADINKPINVTVTYKLVDSNTNDAFALDSKNGLHEHINVNDNGGYDADYWGKINVDDWNYTTNGNTITIKGYKGNNPSSLIIPNGADFDFIYGQNNNNSRVEISSDVMRDLAKNATRIGLSKTANNKVAASDAIWQDAFGGMTNKPGTTRNANGGIKYGSPNLAQMDLHNLDTATITNMSSLFNGGSNLTTVGDLSDWNTSNVTTMRAMFQEASGLTNIGDLDNWNTNNVTNMSYMFRNTTSLTNIGNLSKWQTGNVTDMSDMFSNATNLTNIGNLGNWDTNKVTNMSWMFGTGSRKQSHLTNIGNLSKWQTGNVTDMHDMFSNATNLTNIGNLDNWDTSKVTDMNWMFGGTTSLTNIGNLSKWQTDNVTNMSSMFYNATKLTNLGKLNNWDTSKVTDMNWMFSGTRSLTNIGNLSKWQTGNVTDMHDMFSNATKLTNIGNLDNWDTSKVTDMSDMFANTTNLTNIGDLSKWQTGNVTDMSSMFSNATKLTNIGNLSKWQTGNVTDMSYMFMNAKALHNLNISNWDLTKLVNKNAMIYMFANDANLTVIANDLKLPTWYQNEINDADYFWNSHMAVITNVPELIRATGDINNLKINDQNTSRSIFYDSKGSSNAIQVLKDANQAYINKYEQDHPKYLLALDASVDQTDPIALANAKFKTSHKIIDVIQTNNATRTVIVHLPNGTMQTIVQTIGLKRNAQKDLVTEIISSTAPWGLDEANSSYTIDGTKQAQTAYKQNSNIITFSSIKLPKVPGYKAKVTRNNGVLMVNYLVFAPEKPAANNNLNELQFSNKLVTNSTVQFNSTIKSNTVIKSDMYQVANDDHNWQLPVIKSYDLKFATNKNQIIFAYTKDKQSNYRFVLTFKDGQYRLTTFNKQGKLLKTYSIKSYKKLVKIIHSLVSMNITW